MPWLAVQQPVGLLRTDVLIWEGLSAFNKLSKRKNV